MPGPAISREHEEAGDFAAQVLSDAGFLVDREVDIEVDVEGMPPQKFNLDVCAMHEDTLIIVEAKTKRRVNFKLEILGWDEKRRMLVDRRAVKIIQSRRNVIRTRDFRNVRTITNRMFLTRDTPGPDYLRQAAVTGLGFWFYEDLDYYHETAKVLGHWTKYEIMYDLKLRTTESSNGPHVRAIEGKQPGGSYYLCKMNPLDLLRIAYVYRRGDDDTMAYQRIVKQKKVESMSAFLQRNETWLPNNIILAIDPALANRIHFEDGWLDLPGDYCSAWVVDGQHRLFGFVNTKFEREPTDGRAVERFDVPVVVYRGLDESAQAAMFVDINNNQKKIDPTLLADLSTVLKDLSRKETWPSMVAKKLAGSAPFAGLVKISQKPTRGKKKPITLAGLSKYALYKDLLSPTFAKGKISGYVGSLFNYAPFDWKLSAGGPLNRNAMERQVGLLTTYFTIVKALMGRKWTNDKKYGLTTYTGINALLLVLNRILTAGVSLEEASLRELLKPLSGARLPITKRKIIRFANYPGFRGLANRMIGVINASGKGSLAPYEEKAAP